jgi:soluble lytic murein transglycosylase-like protein
MKYVLSIIALLFVNNSIACPRYVLSQKHGQVICKSIDDASKKYGVSSAIIAAVIAQESSFKVRAKGSAGEIGLMQVKPSTAKWVCKKNKLKWRGANSLYNPRVNVEIGAAYLSMLLKKFKGEKRAVRAYNAGPNGKQKRSYSTGVTRKLVAMQMHELPIMGDILIP